MAGMTTAGFEPDSYEGISNRIKGRLRGLIPDFDFSIESPDGQLIDIMTAEMAELWNQLDLLYMSYNPNLATGEALRNLGLISGHVYQKAQRSHCTIDLTGTAGTVIPQYSTFTDADGHRFMSLLEAVVPSSVDVMAELTGNIPVPAGTVATIEPVIGGLDSIDQPVDGKPGGQPKSEAHFRNTRLRTVMRNSSGIGEAIESRLIELGMEQAEVLNNDSAVNLPDGTPSGYIHVLVGEVSTATDAEIAAVILKTKPLGCPTFGTTTVATLDNQGNSHDIKFTRATEVFIFINLEVTFLDPNIGGVVERIKYELSQYINAHLAGQDVIWSRLFEYITPYGKAQIDLLEIGTTAGIVNPANVVIADDEHASNLQVDITVTVNT